VPRIGSMKVFGQRFVGLRRNRERREVITPFYHVPALFSLSYHYIQAGWRSWISLYMGRLGPFVARARQLAAVLHGSFELSRGQKSLRKYTGHVSLRMSHKTIDTWSLYINSDEVKPVRHICYRSKHRIQLKHTTLFQPFRPCKPKICITKTRWLT